MAKLRTTLGDSFKNICFVGLNRVEYLPEGADESIFGDTWQDITDEQARRSLGLAFFAPRDLSGTPVSPAEVLLEEAPDENATDDALMESFRHIPLLDFCRIPPADSNTVNIIVAADIIFHWDTKDCYLQPTSQLTWVQDVKQIVKQYGRISTARVYTNWGIDKLSELKIDTFTLRDIPIYSEVWLNMPTMQEKYGTHVLSFAIAVAVLVYGALYMQENKIKSLAQSRAQVARAIPSGLNYDMLNNTLQRQLQFMRYRDLLPIVHADVGRAVQLSAMKASVLEVGVFNPNQPTDQLILTVTATEGAYNGWLQEEPIAKSLLAMSNTLTAIRRQPGERNMKLEGLVYLADVARDVQGIKSRMNSQTLNPNAPSIGTFSTGNTGSSSTTSSSTTDKPASPEGARP